MRRCPPLAKLLLSFTHAFLTSSRAGFEGEEGTRSRSATSPQQRTARMQCFLAAQHGILTLKCCNLQRKTSRWHQRHQTHSRSRRSSRTTISSRSQRSSGSGISSRAAREAAEGRNEEDEDTALSRSELKPVSARACAHRLLTGSASSLTQAANDAAGHRRSHLVAREAEARKPLLTRSGSCRQSPNVRHEPPCARTVLLPLTAELPSQRLFFTADPHPCAAAFH